MNRLHRDQFVLACLATGCVGFLAGCGFVAYVMGAA